MKIEDYLRNEFSTYLRSLLIKNKCEQCGSTKSLELHHEKQFAKTLNETLEELKLDYKASEDYSIKELKQLSNIMLGKQLKQNYLTLCSKCHKDIKVDNFRPKNSKELFDNIMNCECNLPRIDYYKKDNPWEGLKYLKEEFEKGNITLKECMYQSAQLGILHPGFTKSHLSDEEKAKINDILIDIKVKFPK